MQFLWFLSELRTPFGNTLFSLFTHLGEQSALLMISLTVFWCSSKEKGYYLLSVGFLGSAINQFLKLCCRIPRPWIQDPDFPIVETARANAGGYSFPSGHTQNATGLFGGLARCYHETRFRAVCILLLLLVAVSRCYLGVHFPSDVLASLAIGWGLVFLLYPFFLRAENQPGKMLGFFAACCCLTVLKLLHAMFLVPDNVDAANLTVAIKNSWSMLGCFLGLLVAYLVERHWIRFDPHAVWWIQLLKLAGGLPIVLVLRNHGGRWLGRLLGNSFAVTCGLRYFLILLFAILFWPMLFQRISLKVKNHSIL